ncbi:MAG: hypothetical protein AAFM92_10525 [Pseudomonadota bacterium]
MRRALALSLAFLGSAAWAEPPGDGTNLVAQCVSCHLTPDGGIDIVGLAALKGLPEEWPFLFEDAYDLDDDGIAGRMRFVSGKEGPSVGIFGSALSAGRFEDFASIAAGAHGITIRGEAEMRRLNAAFEVLSPSPGLPFATDDDQARFEERGCASCHVTRTFEHAGETYMPLSDFLLHDVGDGPRRTAPLWGCPSCLKSQGHEGLDMWSVQ